MVCETTVPISVLIPVKNEENNIGRCLEALKGWADEIVVADSQSTDKTAEIAASYGATVIQFHYAGGLPKKRQWMLDTYEFRHEWILLLDADEILSEPLKTEIAEAIKSDEYDGYWLRFQIIFLRRQLKYGNTELWKLFLFRKNKGRYEKRLDSQDASMSDIEVHEHIILDGKAGRLKHPVRHENFNSLDRYIRKHNEYSNWEARVYLNNEQDETDMIKPSLWGTQAQRRRWLKKNLLSLPGSPLMFFFYKYIIYSGFLDGIPGLIYCVFQAIQMFHIKAKLYELRIDGKYRKSKTNSEPNPLSV